MNKRNFLVLVLFVIGFSFLIERGEALRGPVETIPEEVVEDLYYHDSVYLRNLEYPEDLSSKEGESSAKIEGTGTVVIGKQKTGGFPRLVLFGETEVTSKRYFGDTGFPVWWDGGMFVPEKIIKPSKHEISFENKGSHRGAQINIIEAYQFGEINEEFSFSQEAYAIFNLKIMDGVKVWIAELNRDEGWSIEEEKFCIIKDNLCSVKLSEGVNQMIFVQESYSGCPVERVENGSYGLLPECAIICDPGYVLNYENLSCVRPYNLDEKETLFRAEFAQKYNLFNKQEVSQGYFRYRDTRGFQLEQTDSTGLEGAEKAFVDKRNMVKSNRLKKPDPKESERDKSLWEAIQDLKYDLWRESSRERVEIPKEDPPEETFDEGSIENKEEVDNVIDNGIENEPETFAGGILPRTGPGAFVGLIIAGIALIGFARRRK